MTDMYISWRAGKFALTMTPNIQYVYAISGAFSAGAWGQCFLANSPTKMKENFAYNNETLVNGYLFIIHYHNQKHK